MTKVDQFESVFRAAIKDHYQYQRIEWQSVLVVTDLEEGAAQHFLDDIKRFAKVIHMDGESHWRLLNKNDFTSTQSLLEIVENTRPELIFTYRNLHSEAWRYPHSLGEHLDVLVNKTNIPVVILPNPHADFAHDHAMINTNRVMAITDHLSNDHNLVNYAVRFTEDDGVLFLVHIEDAAVFDRYMQTIAKIANIDTQEAQEQIRHQLLKEPHDYIRTVRDVISTHNLPIKVEEIVAFGHRLTEVHKYISQYKVDLLVMNSQDQQQMAMHGMVYPLAVELRQIPLLLI